MVESMLSITLYLWGQKWKQLRESFYLPLEGRYFKSEVEINKLMCTSKVIEKSQEHRLKYNKKIKVANILH